MLRPGYPDLIVLLPRGVVRIHLTQVEVALGVLDARAVVGPERVADRVHVDRHFGGVDLRRNGSVHEDLADGLRRVRAREHAAVGIDRRPRDAVRLLEVGDRRACRGVLHEGVPDRRGHLERHHAVARRVVAVAGPDARDDRRRIRICGRRHVAQGEEVLGLVAGAGLESCGPACAAGHDLVLAPPVVLRGIGVSGQDVGHDVGGRRRRRVGDSWDLQRHDRIAPVVDDREDQVALDQRAAIGDGAVGRRQVRRMNFHGADPDGDARVGVRRELQPEVLGALHDVRDAVDRGGLHGRDVKRVLKGLA